MIKQLFEDIALIKEDKVYVLGNRCISFMFSPFKDGYKKVFYKYPNTYTNGEFNDTFEISLEFISTGEFFKSLKHPTTMYRIYELDSEDELEAVKTMMELIS